MNILGGRAFALILNHGAREGGLFLYKDINLLSSNIFALKTLWNKSMTKDRLLPNCPDDRNVVKTDAPSYGYSIPYFDSGSLAMCMDAT